MTTSNDISLQVFHTIDEIDQEAWDQFSAGRAFASYTWYRYAEKAMSDCQPFYVVASLHGQATARATFWKIRNDPLPIPKLLRSPMGLYFHYRPLLICRSPLSNTSGLLNNEPAQAQALKAALTNQAKEIARQEKCSAILLDFASKNDVEHLTADYSTMSFSNAGTIMENRWKSLDDYLAQGNKKDRQHYKRSLREAEKLGIEVTRLRQVENLEEAMPLIREVERRHDAPINPWVPAMLKHANMIESTFLTARIGEKLVGCGLIVEDSGTQMTSALGLAPNVPYVYFMLIYESLKIAFEHQVRLLRWGSGAYDVKGQLGFEMEDNALVAYHITNPMLQKLYKLF